jgi:hypothetical protein
MLREQRSQLLTLQSHYIGGGDEVLHIAVIAQSPKLKPAAKEVVKYDYGMTDGRTTITVRLELLKDFLGEHSPLVIPSKPLKLRKDNGQIAIENAAEIERLLK